MHAFVCVHACVRVCVHVCICVTVVLSICASSLVLWSWTLSVIFFCLFIRCQYCNGNKMLPVSKQSTSKEHYSFKTLEKLLLDTDSTVATGKCEVCSTKPVQVCHNVAFLVDLHALDDAMDIKVYENGVWEHNCSPVSSVSVHRNGSNTTVHKRNKLGSHSHHYKLTRV